MGKSVPNDKSRILMTYNCGTPETPHKVDQSDEAQTLMIYFLYWESVYVYVLKDMYYQLQKLYIQRICQIYFQLKHYFVRFICIFY